MTKLIKIDPVWVNPAHVIGICPIKDATHGTEINCLEEILYLVDGAPDEVAAILNGTPRIRKTVDIPPKPEPPQNTRIEEGSMRKLPRP